MIVAEPAVLRREALTDQASEVVRQRIIEQVYAPGQRLRVEEVAQSLGVSATPVREALNRLVSERLVVLDPGRGFAVAPELDPRQYAELFDVTIWLQEKAAEAGTIQVVEAELAVMARAIAGMAAACQERGYEASRSYFRHDRAFHTQIIATARNSVLLSLWELWNPHVHFARLIYRAFATGAIAAMRRSAEHQPILDAFRARDPVAAVRAVRQHGEAAKQRWLGALDSAEPAARALSPDGLRHR